jgi:hypothetical protein
MAFWFVAAIVLHLGLVSSQTYSPPNNRQLSWDETETSGLVLRSTRALYSGFDGIEKSKPHISNRPSRQQPTSKSMKRPVQSEKLYDSTLVDKDFEVMMCGRDGFCSENATTPTPRTRFTCNDKQQYESWFRFQRHLKTSAEAYAARMPFTSGIRPLVFIGDSITESFLGTSIGTKVERATGTEKVHIDPQSLVSSRRNEQSSGYIYQPPKVEISGFYFCPRAA